MIINNFNGKYEFLSNFYHSPIVIDNIEYPTVEHAYQCQKTFNHLERSKILYLPDGKFTPPGVCKKIGKKVSLRSDWEEVKDNIMFQCLIEKFSNEKLANLLLDTGDSELIEGNWWNDTYWGVCKGKGLNKLGIMLMNIRSHLKGE